MYSLFKFSAPVTEIRQLALKCRWGLVLNTRTWINDHEPEMVILFDDFERNANTHLQENLIRPYGVTWTQLRD